MKRRGTFIVVGILLIGVTVLWWTQRKPKLTAQFVKSESGAAIIGITNEPECVLDAWFQDDRVKRCWLRRDGLIRSEFEFLPRTGDQVVVEFEKETAFPLGVELQYAKGGPASLLEHLNFLIWERLRILLIKPYSLAVKVPQQTAGTNKTIP